MIRAGSGKVQTIFKFRPSNNEYIGLLDTKQQGQRIGEDFS